MGVILPPSRSDFAGDTSPFKTSGSEVVSEAEREPFNLAHFVVDVELFFAILINNSIVIVFANAPGR
jgi:hypothetical protein